MSEAQEVEVEAEVDKIREAFDVAISEDKTGDEVKIALLNAGVPFKSITRLYTKYMIDAGYAVSKTEKDEIVTKILEGKEVKEEADFDKAVAAIVKKANGVNEKSAASLIRSWAKSNDQEVYAKPKGSGGPRDSVRSRFFNALIANPSMTQKQCTEHLEKDVDTSNNVMNHESVYQGIRELVNNIANPPVKDKAA